MTSESEEFSKKRFTVSVYEIRQEIVFAEEFAGKYLKTVTWRTDKRAPLN